MIISKQLAQFLKPSELSLFGEFQAINIKGSIKCRFISTGGRGHNTIRAFGVLVYKNGKEMGSER